MSFDEAAGATGRLEGYLAAFRTRLKRMRIARGAAALAAAALAITVVGVAIAIRAGFLAEIFIVTRVLLLAVLAALAVWLIVLPLRRVNRGAIDEIEARTPALGGRVETYAGMRDRGNPFVDLLAEDTLAVTAAHPVEQQVRPRELAVPAAIGGVCVLTLLWLAIAGPGLFSYGVRHLWAGWAVSDLLPPQSIAVTPGDEAVRRGGSVPLLAEMQGFDPASATVHARIGAGEWEEVGMARTERGFEFTFFSVREPLEYYVAAAGTRSPSYQVSVVDLPSVGNLRLTLNYPGWTGRPPEVKDPGGDINTVSGTGVDLEITADAALPAAELVLNDKTVPMTTEGVNGKTRFDVTADGRYYVAARIGSEQVRLTEDYFIKILPDGKPEIKLSRPGRDWNASSIEEVTAQVEATDDYALSALEVHYAVNGGEWQTVKLPVSGRETKTDHVLALESIETTDIDSGTARPLAPGDLISYYAVAKDRRQTTQTDMFFIDVRPFDRRYSQGQSGGGGGGGGGGGQESEISQRQREIIVSTWNLVREAQSGERRESRSGTVRDNATLLAELQRTLAGQAKTLAERANARELSADPQIAGFVENMTKAAGAMEPAAERLAAIDLQKAIQPAQQALQYLLRAEAAFTDVQVAMQQGGGGGGGGQAGRDLADMLEIEMDLEKNQYETGNPASLSADSGEQEMDDIARKLQELARRQEQLAASARQQQQLTEAQRWQQESLKREAEELQRRVESLQRQAANGQQQPGQQSGQPGQSSQSGQSGQQGSRQAAAQRLESAVRAMNEAGEAMRSGEGGIDRERLSRAATEAQRQLAQARDDVTRQQQESLQNSLSSMAARAGDLYEAQREVDQELQESVRKLLAQRPAGNREQSGLTPEQEDRLAGVKTELGTNLDRLERDITNSARSLANSDKSTAAALEGAVGDLRDSQLQARIAIAADYIRRGGAAFVAGSESAVTDGLRDLRDQLRRAQSMAGGPGAPGEDSADEALSRVQALRRELQQLANAAQQGNGQRGAGQNADQNADQNGQGQQGAGEEGQEGPGQENAGQSAQNRNGQGQGQGQQGSQGSPGQGQAQGNQSGQGGDSGAMTAGNAGGGQEGGQLRGGTYGNGGSAITGGLGPVGGGWRGSWWDRPMTGSLPPVDVRDDMRRDINAATRDVRQVLPELDQRGISAADLEAIRKLASQLDQARFEGGSQLLERELKANLALLEQLELKLSQSLQNDRDAKVRTAVADRVPEEYKDAVAEYYRRLSKDK